MNLAESTEESPQKIPLMTIACPLCNAEAFDAHIEARDYLYQVPGSYRFVRCRSCDHIYINPRPIDEALLDCYPAEYAPHLQASPGTGGGSTASADATPPVRSPIRRWIGRIPYAKRLLLWLFEQHGTVVFHPPTSGDKRLLEVGCAHGSYLEVATNNGWEVDGIEPSDSAAQRARDRGFAVVTSTLTRAELEPACREAIVAWMVLEHVPDPRAFVETAFSVLTPGGRFAVSVPNAHSLDCFLFGRHWLGYDAPRHLQVFTARRLRELLVQTGFENVRVQHQANVRYWWGSMAACGMDLWPQANWPYRWMRYFIHQPPRYVDYLSVLPAKFFSIFRCSGRITVTASKPSKKNV